MANMKKMIAGNKLCAFITVTAVFSLTGMLLAKCMITNCCQAEKLKCKAKKAFKSMGNCLMD